MNKKLIEFGASLYASDGPEVNFFSIPYPTRMAIAKLKNGDLWVWSPIALTDQLIAEVNSLGKVQYIISPNKIHHLFMNEWKDQWPEAKLYAMPSLIKRKPEIPINGVLKDKPEPEWAEEINQVVFRGSLFMDEVAFFHKPSQTAIICDLIQRHSSSKIKGFKGLLMRLDGLVGDRGSTPREWRASFLKRTQARAAREKVLNWNAEQLLIAHGKCAHSSATEIIRQALCWI